MTVFRHALVAIIRSEFLGSVTQKVLRRAPVTVLVVPPVR